MPAMTRGGDESGQAAAEVVPDRDCLDGGSYCSGVVGQMDSEAAHQNHPVAIE